MKPWIAALFFTVALLAGCGEKRTVTVTYQHLANVQTSATGGVHISMLRGITNQEKDAADFTFALPLVRHRGYAPYHADMDIAHWKHYPADFMDPGTSIAVKPGAPSVTVPVGKPVLFAIFDSEEFGSELRYLNYATPKGQSVLMRQLETGFQPKTVKDYESGRVEIQKLRQHFESKYIADGKTH